MAAGASSLRSVAPGVDIDICFWYQFMISGGRRHLFFGINNYQDFSGQAS
jgi:hypothetical protein